MKTNNNSLFKELSMHSAEQIKSYKNVNLRSIFYIKYFQICEINSILLKNLNQIIRLYSKLKGFF